MARTGYHYEDLEPGQTFGSDFRTITEADHVNFTTSFGFFEPLFMDRLYLKSQTPYKGRVVPGALTFSMAEGLTILTGILTGTGLAFLGVELKALKPVYIGDTLSVEIEVADKRKTTKPGRGIVTFDHRVKNQTDIIVMEYRIKRMIRMKEM